MTRCKSNGDGTCACIDRTKVFEAWGVGEPGEYARRERWGRGIGRDWRNPEVTREIKPIRVTYYGGFAPGYLQ